MNHEVVKKIGERAGVDPLMLGLLRRKALQVSRHKAQALIGPASLDQSERGAGIFSIMSQHVLKISKPIKMFDRVSSCHPNRVYEWDHCM